MISDVYLKTPSVRTPDFYSLNVLCRMKGKGINPLELNQNLTMLVHLKITYSRFNILEFLKINWL